MSKLRAGDYEQMLDLVVAVLESSDPEALWPLVLKHLREAFFSDTVTYAWMRAGERTGHVEGWAPEWIGEVIEDIVDRRIRQRYPLVSYIAADQYEPVVVSELCPDWRRTEWYDEIRGLCGSTQQLGLPVPGEPGSLRAVVIGRDGDFGPHGLAFARRVQPLIIAADRHIEELRRLRAAVPGPVPARDDHGLTVRERTVLGLLAEGLTAEAIGRRLVISTHTVNRHLEKIYRKLGTNNRVSTVSLARRSGLVAG
ncbi:LuxR C-terminal-related transcriptional regulator [Streptomyces sp. NPDC002537]